MKVAVVIDDEKTISRHFGRALQYMVFTVEAGEIVGKALRAKPGHQTFAQEPHNVELHDHSHEHGMDAHSGHKHDQMLDPIHDCEAVIVRGMGTGAYLAIKEANLVPFVTDLGDPEEAVHAYVSGSLVDHSERLH